MSRSVILLLIGISSVRGFLGHGHCRAQRSSPLLAGFSGIDSDLTKALQDRFQVTEPNSIQAGALSLALAGQDVVVLSQTGSGKTMTFLLPILQRIKNDPDARALILAPTDVLVEQHRYVAEQLSPAVSGITFSTPQRFLDNQDPSRDDDFDMVALDEVDALLYGGCDDDTLTAAGAEILNCISETTTAQYIVTTAYLSQSHETALLHRDFSHAECVREAVTNGPSSVLVPTLRQRFQYFSGDKNEKLVNVLRKSEEDAWLSEGSTIVFCGSVENAKQICEKIEDEKVGGTTVAMLHDDLDPESRTDMLNMLRSTKDRVVLVCTDLAARGLDVPNVRHVILYSVPTDVGAFVHQVGRTARRGQQGILTCLVLTGSADYARYTHLHALKGASKLVFATGS